MHIYTEKRPMYRGVIYASEYVMENILGPDINYSELDFVTCLVIEGDEFVLTPADIKYF